MSWILTHSARHFDYLDPRPSDISILDIAHALSHESRYAGHSLSFYSVAQNAWHCSHLVDPEYALEALLHDGAEAYCKDIPRPLKDLLPDYQAIEARVDGIVRAHFGLPRSMSEAVKRADMVMLATERRDIMPADATPWAALANYAPTKRTITTMPPPKAKALFLQRYLEICLAQGALL